MDRMCSPPNSYIKALIRDNAKDPSIEKSFQVSRIMGEEILMWISADQRVLR